MRPASTVLIMQLSNSRAGTIELILKGGGQTGFCSWPARLLCVDLVE